MVGTRLGHDDQMSVSDAVAVGQETDALEGKRGAHTAADALSDDHDALRDFVGDVGEVIDVCLGNHEAFAGGGRAERHERGDGVVCVDYSRVIGRRRCRRICRASGARDEVQACERW